LAFYNPSKRHSSSTPQILLNIAMQSYVIGSLQKSTSTSSLQITEDRSDRMHKKTKKIPATLCNEINKLNEGSF
jgi:hypothetical protein